jgi:hypothetical protein
VILVTNLAAAATFDTRLCAHPTWTAMSFCSVSATPGARATPPISPGRPRSVTNGMRRLPKPLRQTRLDDVSLAALFDALVPAIASRKRVAAFESDGVDLRQRIHIPAGGVDSHHEEP